MTISTRSISSQEPTAPITSFPVHWCCVPIPEHELDKALAIYRKQDSTFKQRIKKAAMYFSPKDAETLIRLATYGIVQLELIVRPTPIPEKPYYLCY